MPRYYVSAIQVSSKTLRTCSSGEGGGRVASSPFDAVRSVLGPGAIVREHAPAAGPGECDAYMIEMPKGSGLGGLDAGFWETYVRENRD